MKHYKAAFFFIVCLLLGSFLYGCGPDRDTAWEQEKKALVEQYLGKNPAISYSAVTMDSTDKSVTIADVKVVFDARGSNSTRLIGEWSAKKFVATGIADDAKGIVELADNVILSDVAFRFDEQPSGNGTKKELGHTAGTVGEVIFKKPVNDIGMLAAIFSPEKERLHELLATREGLNFTGIVVKKFSAAMSFNSSHLGDVNALLPDEYQDGAEKMQDDKLKNMTFSLDELSFDKLPKNGMDFQAKNYALKANEMTILSAESTKLKVNAAPDLLKAAKEDMPFEELIKHDIDIETFEITGLKEYTPFGMIENKRMALSFQKTSDMLTFKSRAEDTVIPLQLMDMAFAAAGAGKFSDLHNKPLAFSSNSEITGTLKDGKLTLDIPSIAIGETSLFSLETSLSLSADGVTVTPQGKRPFEAKNWYVKAGKAVVRDSGALDLGFTIAAVVQQGLSGKEAKDAGRVMRTQVAVFVPSMCASSLGPAYKGFCDTLGKSLASPGTLEALLEPSNPLLLEDAFMKEAVKDPDKLGLTWKFTPAK